MTTRPILGAAAGLRNDGKRIACAICNLIRFLRRILGPSADRGADRPKPQSGAALDPTRSGTQSAWATPYAIAPNTANPLIAIVAMTNTPISFQKLR